MSKEINKERQVSEKLGSVLRYYREKRGYSLQKLFELTGVSASYLNRLESGERRNPSVPILLKISKVLDVPLGKIIQLANDDVAEMKKVPTIAELLMYNEFSIDEQLINQDAKEIIVDILENIIDYIWDGKEKNREIFELLSLIEDFKEAI